MMFTVGLDSLVSHKQYGDVIIIGLDSLVSDEEYSDVITVGLDNFSEVRTI